MKIRQPGLEGLVVASVVLALFARAGWAQVAPSVSMVTLKTTTKHGKQTVIIPSGQQLALPGPGTSGDSVTVFIGSQGGYWYVDKTGENFDLTPYVSELTVSAQQGSNNVGSSSNSSDSSNSSSGETAAAAGLGAAAGAAAGYAYSEYNNQYDIPYGAAILYGGDGRPYYTAANGNPVYVNNQAVNVNGSSNLAKQQEWYAQQHSGNSEKFKSWKQNSTTGKNPFVATEETRRRGPFGGGGPFGKGKPDGAPNAASAGEGHRGGPFGGRPGGPRGDASAGAAIEGSEGGPFGKGKPGGPFGRGGGPGAESVSGMGSVKPSGGPGGGPFGGRRPGGPPAGGKIPAGGPPGGGRLPIGPH